MAELGDTVVLDTNSIPSITVEEYNMNCKAYFAALDGRLDEFLEESGLRKPTDTKFGYRIKPIEPCGYLIHKPTKTRIAVYFPMKRFHKLMIRLCFGLEYVEVNK